MGSSGEKVTYPPLDVLKPVAENVWIVDSGPQRVLGIPLPIRMTVIRLRSGELWLHSPTRYDNRLRDAMDRLGRIRHLVAPNIAHWSFLKEWQQRCPDALTWAAPSLRQRSQARKAHLKIDRDLDDAAAREWSDEMVQAVVPGGANFQEVAFFHLPTRTLVLTDLVENLEPGKVSPWIRPVAKLLGVLAPDGMAPVYLRMIVKRKRRDAAQAVARMIDWQPERVIFSHGAWFEHEGTNALRRSMRWLL
jgi:Domain of unknown function (DUF4336)